MAKKLIRRRIKRTESKTGTSVVSLDTPQVGVQVESSIIPETAISSDSPLADVNVSLGITIGLPRKFEFARIDVSARIPHVNTPEAREQAYKQAEAFASEKLSEKVQNIRTLENPVKKEEAL